MKPTPWNLQKSLPKKWWTNPRVRSNAKKAGLRARFFYLTSVVLSNLNHNPKPEYEQPNPNNPHFNYMIINLISGPRNISTALMYSFAQREDTKVVDEPFYASYLDRFPEIEHPGKQEILQSMAREISLVLSEIEELSKKHEVVFLKNMAHHHLGISWDYLLPLNNVFLIRNPKQLIASFAQVIEQPTLQDIGLKEEVDLFQYVAENGHNPAIVLDSATILENPEKGLKLLCQKLEIPFTEKMLSWQKGAIAEDGVWASYWYKNVHGSSGFAKQKTSERSLPTHCEALYQEALPHYQTLIKQAINL